MSFIGLTDAMNCFGGDLWACGSLILGMIPWGKLMKVGKIAKAIDRTINAIQAWRSAKKAAEAVLATARAAERMALQAKKAAIERAKRAAQAAQKKAAEKARTTSNDAVNAAKKTGNPVQKDAQAKANPGAASSGGGGGKGGGSGAKPGGSSGGSSRSNGGTSGGGGSGKSGDGPDGGDTCNSFLPGTQVLMADGSTKAIEDVRAGDEVESHDSRTGENQAQAVTAEIRGEGDKNLVRVTVDTDGDGDGDEGAQVTATDGHPFWVVELADWVPATELQPGQWLRTSAGTFVQITAVDRSTSSQAAVHNLTVGDLHTYYVVAGGSSLLVHNCDVTVYRVEGAANERIRVHEDGSVLVRGANKTLFLGFDNRARAEEFLAKRLEQGFSDSVIKSFKVKREFLDYLRADMVPESMSKQFPTRPISVDHPAADQYGLKPFNTRLMLEYIVPNSGAVG
ncbi:hypothetical protein GCM10020358_36710 [Amorphoplanes nipponensis]